MSKAKNLPIRYFRLLKGRHIDAEEKLYIANDDKRNIVKSHEDLCKKYTNKFEEITERMAAQSAMAKEDIEKAALQLGAEVTGRYPDAEAAGLRVFRNEAKEYWVTDKEDSRPLNKKALNKNNVTDFLALQTA